MKTYFYSTFIISLFLAIGIEGYGQSRTLQKTYRWKYNVNSDVKLTFNNYDCDLIIHTWDNSEIEYKMSVDATLRTGEDAGRLDRFIGNLYFSHSAGSVEINNRFWKSRKNIMGKKTIELKGEKTIRYSNFKMKGELWIPANSNLNLTSKYSGIEMEDISGRVSLELYNDKLFGGLIGGNTEIAAKYSTIEFKDMKDIDANLYNTDIETGNIGNLNVTSKYSTFRSGDAGKLDINAYNDKYFFGNTNDIKFVDKYSDLTAGLAGNIDLECYTSTVTISSIEDIELNSKYSKYELGNADNFNISNTYSDNYKIKSLKTLNIIETKYGSYKIDELLSSLRMDNGYSDKFIILKTSPDFKGLKANGKYEKIQIATGTDFDYRFKANVKYPKFDINEEAMKTKIKIKESSQLEMEAIKGTEREGMPEFTINGYDVALIITEYH